MPDYAVFGGCLRSEMSIPELRLADLNDGAMQPSWTFQTRDGHVPEIGSPLLIGQDEVFENVRATFTRGPNTLRLQFDDTGTFDLHDHATRIVWYPKDGHQPDVARADLVGRVLPLAQHERGLLAIHASAVCFAGRAVAFMAPKNYGKSTLAMTLVARHGAQLLTDDTLVVEPGTAVAVPGVHSVRLWGETAARFTDLGSSRPVLSDKRIFEDLPVDSLARGEAPLDALYTLVPTAGDGAEPVRREALDGVGATMAIIQYQKLGALLGGPDSARVFEGAATLATRSQVFVLYIARDLARLPEVARSVAQWHNG